MSCDPAPVLLDFITVAPFLMSSFVGVFSICLFFFFFFFTHASFCSLEDSEEQIRSPLFQPKLIINFALHYTPLTPHPHPSCRVCCRRRLHHHHQGNLWFNEITAHTDMEKLVRYHIWMNEMGSRVLGHQSIKLGKRVSC